jgi:hypothetical protein
MALGGWVIADPFCVGDVVVATGLTLIVRHRVALSQWGGVAGMAGA